MDAGRSVSSELQGRLARHLAVSECSEPKIDPPDQVGDRARGSAFAGSRVDVEELEEGGQVSEGYKAAERDARRPNGARRAVLLHSSAPVRDPRRYRNSLGRLTLYTTRVPT